ncbi:oligosaccharide flippase family protein [Paenibacillus sp. LMG 31456]|uniref:Oligosaccharide flippase family protein n=1 Tax=Paenibacillus foliorum TaxID=2654974 RepID=A0A972GRM1_9BACL|nr:oligosaccharide flippase family protein [Paenibacillus foliorum]NOU95113.1 oligosaccharide flippase family protein [Paenibacillus foliorum]
MISKLKLGALTSYLAMFLNNILSFLFTPFLVNSLGKSQYGIYALMGALIGYMILLDFGIGNSLVRYIAKYRAEEDCSSESKFFSLCLLIYSGISVLSLVIGIIVYSHFDSIFNQGLSPHELEMAKIIFGILIINLVIAFPFNAFSGVIRGHEKFTFLNLTTMVRALIRICLLIVLLSLGYKAVTVVIVDTMLNLLVGVINALYVFFIIKVRIVRPKTPFVFVLKIFQQSSLSFVISFSSLVIWQLGNVLLGIFAGAVSVALYAVGLQFTIYYMNVAGSISSVLIPRITMMVTNNVSETVMTNFLIRTARLQFIVLCYIMIGFSLFGKGFLVLWLGPDYSTAWVIAMILMIPQTFTLLLSIPGAMLVARNRHGFKALVSIINAAIIAVVIYFMVRTYGAFGASLGTSLGMLIAEIIIMSIYYHVQLRINMLRFWKETVLDFLPYVSISILFGIVIIIQYPINSWGIFILEGLVYTIIYCGLLYKFGVNDYEKSLIKSLKISFLNLRKRHRLGG